MNREICAEIVGNGEQRQLEESEAVREMLASVYPELRRIARAKLGGERRGHTLQPTALTNEVVVRLLRREIAGEDPQMLLWAGIVEMRRVLIDYGRRWQVRQRHVESLKFEEKQVEVIEDAVHLELLLDQLEVIDPRGRKVVELRFFLGLSVKECAELLGLSMRTVNEDWEFARSWLAMRWNQGSS